MGNSAITIECFPNLDCICSIFTHSFMEIIRQYPKKPYFCQVFETCFMPIKSFIYLLVFLSEILKTTCSTGDQTSNIRGMAVSATNGATQSRISLYVTLQVSFIVIILTVIKKNSATTATWSSWSLFLNSSFI